MLKLVFLMLLGMVIVVVIVAYNHISFSKSRQSGPHPSVITEDFEALNSEIMKKPYLMVMFTTFKEGSPHHVIAHALAAANWASFRNRIKPVLFTDMTPRDKTDGLDLTQVALSYGWDVLAIPSKSSYGAPRLRPMFNMVCRRYKASFYGYANGTLSVVDGSNY